MRRTYLPRSYPAALAMAFGSTAVCSVAPAQDVSETEGLAEVVVTAQRRTENLQKVPIAATVVTGEDLAEKGVTGLTSLQYTAPSLTVSDYGSANVLNIRGIGRSQVDIELPSAVVIYRDGVPTFPGYFQNEPYYDIRAIEVLRGPQGTFVGKSAAGGAIFVRTNNPELGSFSTDVSAGFGNFNQYEGTLVVNAPIGDEFALRAAYHHTQRDHYYDSIRGDYSGHPGERDMNSGRLGAYWKPNDELEVLVKADVSRLDFGGLPISSYQTPAYDIVNNVNFAYVDETARVIADVKYHLESGATLSSLTGYQRSDTVNNYDRNGANPAIDIFNSAGQFQLYAQEFNIVSPDEGRLSWVVGAFLQRTDMQIYDWRNDGFTFRGGSNVGGVVTLQPFPYFGLNSPYRQREDEMSAFAHLKYDITDRWEVEVGARYSDYELWNHVDIVLGDGVSPPTIPFLNTGRSTDEQDVDVKVALNYRPTADHFMYLIVATGHVTKGFNIASEVPFDKQKVRDYEVGWKADWQDGRVRTQLGAYYQTFDGYQASFQGVGTVVTIPAIQNAQSESKVYGLEGGLEARLANWQFDLGFSTLESELGRFPNIRSPFLPPPNNVIDVTGAKSPFAPELTANVGVAYYFDLSGMTMMPRVDFGYTDEQHAGLIDVPQLRLESRSLWNALLRFSASNDRWWADIYGTNLTDERYVYGVQESGAINYAAPPRMYGVRFGTSF